MPPTPKDWWRGLEPRNLWRWVWFHADVEKLPPWRAPEIEAKSCSRMCWGLVTTWAQWQLEESGEQLLFSDASGPDDASFAFDVAFGYDVISFYYLNVERWKMHWDFSEGSVVLDPFFGKRPDLPTIATWRSGHRIKKYFFWSHYWCICEGKTKQYIFSSTFIFPHTEIFRRGLSFWTHFLVNAQPAHPRHVTVLSQNREIFFMSPLLMKLYSKNKTKNLFIDFFIFSH